MSRAFVRNSPADNFITYGNVIEGLPSMSVAVWAKINSRVDGNLYQFICKPGSGPNGWGLHLISDGRLEFAVFDGTHFDAANSNATHIESGATWRHLGGRRDGTNLGVMVDGATGSGFEGAHSGGTPSATGNNLVVGAFGSPPDARGFDGKLGYITVWSRYLLDAEFATLAGGANPLSVQNASIVFHATLVGGIDDTIGPYTGTNSNTTNSTDEPLTLSALTQEGFRYRADDGSESGASWLAAQDTNINRVASSPARLRVLIDALSDPDAAQYQLEYRKVGTTDWQQVI